MGTETKSNYILAQQEADKTDENIIEILKTGKSFLVEAGAGSGKTHSLLRVIDWIQANKWSEYSKNKQNVICITYTNTAVDVIKARISLDSFIHPSTIHSFAWNAIKQYQSTLIRLIDENDSLKATEGDFYKVNEVKYTLGDRYKENGVQYLFHDDVITLFGMLLDNEKFRKIFSDKYPLILIDEYQDSFKTIMDRFIKYFVDENQGPQFGFFGDSWQTIYQSNNACGEITNENLKKINKGSNFRSAPRIVDFLNCIRPELPQISAIDDYEGEVFVVNCNDYSGKRRTENNFKEDLPVEELKSRIDNLVDHIKNESSDQETLKVLMITHKVLAAQQGYEKLLEVLNNGLRDKQDPFLLFFMNTVEPVYEALESSNMPLLFDTIKTQRYPIEKKSDKISWNKLKLELRKARNKKNIDVLEIVIKAGLIPIPPQVKEYYNFYYSCPELIYPGDVTIKELLDIEYGQFLAAINYFHPAAEFSTEHGAKGEEYDNVIFVISKGWNKYQFDKYVPIIAGLANLPKGREETFESNRNLFYVCCSRAKKRLILFVSTSVDEIFRKSLCKMVGEDNVFTYEQFLLESK